MVRKNKKAKKSSKRFREPKDIEAFHYLHSNQINLFHDAITGKTMVDFSGTSLRGVDLRRVDVKRLNIKGAYLRGADVRGVDFRHHDLEGSSLHDALISGAYFPNNLSPEEITMSVRLGTRLRTNGPLVPPKS